MSDVFTKEDYAIAYAELIEIFNYIPNEELQLIPQNVIDSYLQDRDVNHNYVYNHQLPLEEQNISFLTKVLIANIYISYFAPPNEKAEIKKNDVLVLQEEELKKRKLHSTDNLFNKQITQLQNLESTSMIVAKKERFFMKILNWFKGVFN